MSDQERAILTPEIPTLPEPLTPGPTFPGPTFPIPTQPPWGGTGPFDPTERDSDALPIELYHVLGQGAQMVKRIYSQPDYREVINHFGEILSQELEQDPEALDAFLKLLGRHGVKFEDATDRLVITGTIAAIAIGGSFVVGGVIGYFAEKGKEK